MQCYHGIILFWSIEKEPDGVNMTLDLIAPFGGFVNLNFNFSFNFFLVLNGHKLDAGRLLC